MRLALDAYHRLLGHGVSQSLDSATVSDLLNGVGQFHIRFPSHGKHAEGDLSRQVLALIDKGKVVALYPISSGKPSTPTVLGSFHVYLKTPGYLPDGMYFSSFFTGGYAIHGLNPAPDYPASHGCMRGADRRRDLDLSVAERRRRRRRLLRVANAGYPRPRENRAKYPSPSP